MNPPCGYPKHHLLGLPRELRNLIFVYVFQGPDDQQHSRLRIPVVSKLVYMETHDDAWKHGTHKITLPSDALHDALSQMPSSQRTTITALHHPSLSSWANTASHLRRAGILPITETISLDHGIGWQIPTLPRYDPRSSEDVFAAPLTINDLFARETQPHQPPLDPRPFSNDAIAAAIWHNPKLEGIHLISSQDAINLAQQSSLLIRNVAPLLHKLADQELSARNAPVGHGRFHMHVCGMVNDSDMEVVSIPTYDTQGSIIQHDELWVWREGSSLRIQRSTHKFRGFLSAFPSS